MNRKIATVLAAGVLALTGCGSDDPAPTPAPPVTDSNSGSFGDGTSLDDGGTVDDTSGDGGSAVQNPSGASAISGHVSTADGAPYDEAWVEFKNVYGGNVHTLTDANGDYSLAVPEGVYTALAGDDNDPGVSMSVLGDDNTVEVPGDEVVNFVADS
jgi:hypothetical protein